MIYALIHYTYGTSGLIRGSVRLDLVSVTPLRICLRTDTGGLKFDEKLQGNKTYLLSLRNPLLKIINCINNIKTID